MSFLAALRPHLTEQSEIQLRIRKEKDQLAVTVIPRVSALDANTTDPALAQFHAALSRPFHLTIAEGDDPDAALAEVLTAVATTQASTLGDLKRYQDEVKATAATARETAAAAKEKDAAPKKPAAKPVPGKPAAKVEKPAVTKAAPVTATAAAAEPARVQDLFGAPPAAQTASATAIEAQTPADSDDHVEGNSHD